MPRIPKEPGIPKEPKEPNSAYIESEDGLADGTGGLASDFQNDRQDEGIAEG